MNRSWAEVSQSLRVMNRHTHLSKYAGGASGRGGSQPFMALLGTGTRHPPTLFWGRCSTQMELTGLGQVCSGEGKLM